jgi:hypothetical protein
VGASDGERKKFLVGMVTDRNNYLAKETIGYTPAPLALSQYQLGMPCASLRLCHNEPSLKSSHQSPRELYITEDSFHLLTILDQ